MAPRDKDLEWISKRYGNTELDPQDLDWINSKYQNDPLNDFGLINQKSTNSPLELPSSIGFEGAKTVMHGLNSALFNYGDELVGLFDPQTKQQLRKYDEEFVRDSPYLAGASAIAGGLVSGGVLGKVLGRIISPVKTMIVDNAINESGKAENNDERLTKALEGGVESLAMGGIGKAIGSGIGALKMYQGGKADDILPSQKAIIKMMSDSGYTAEDINRAISKINEANASQQFPTIFESLSTSPTVGGGVRYEMSGNVAKAIQNNIPEAKTFVNSFLNERLKQKPERISNLLEDIYRTGETDPIKAVLAAKKAPSDASRSLYESAYFSNPELSEEAKNALSKIRKFENKNTPVGDAITKASKKLGKSENETITIVKARSELDSEIKRAIEQGNGSDVALFTEWRQKLDSLLPTEIKEADNVYSEVAKSALPRAKFQNVFNSTAQGDSAIKKMFGTPKKQEELLKALDNNPRSLEDFLARATNENIFEKTDQFLSGGSPTQPLQAASQYINDVASGLSTAVGVASKSPSSIASALSKIFSLRENPELQVEITKELFKTGREAKDLLNMISRNMERKESANATSKAIRRIAEQSAKGF
jgi:hypothetical protein